MQYLSAYFSAAVPEIENAFGEFREELDDAVDNLITDITGQVSMFTTYKLMWWIYLTF